MKKSILIFCAVLATLGLAAFGIMHWDGFQAHQTANCSKSVVVDKDLMGSLDIKPEIEFRLGSEFNNTVTKDQLRKAKSIMDLVPDANPKPIEHCHWAGVSLLKDEGEIKASGRDLNLTKPQLKLIRSMDYDDNILVSSSYKSRNEETGHLDEGYFAYYMSVVPEQEAKFSGGMEAFVKYIRQEISGEVSKMVWKDLSYGKVNFVVSSSGKITDVKVKDTCGYTSMDEMILELISNIPGEWQPALTEKGNPVDQTLTLFFGKVGGGC